MAIVPLPCCFWCQQPRPWAFGNHRAFTITLVPHQVLRLAHAKADAIRAKLQATADQAGQPLDGLLVTCDQVGL